MTSKTRPLHILVTAGPTRERIDPVRFISNYSTGTFGYEIAKEARQRGYAVTLVSGPTPLKAPKGITVIDVESANEMMKAVLREFTKSDCVIMAAAVSDWRVRSVSRRKIKKGIGKKTLELEPNPDILEALGRIKKDRILVGFALETEELEKNAVWKLNKKKLDLIIASPLKSGSPPFGKSRIDVLMMDKFGKKTRLFNSSKRELAKIVLDKAEGLGYIQAGSVISKE